MKEPRIVRVSIFASASLDEARLAVMDLLVQLNRTFVPRGVEFALADTSDDVTGEDLAVALYWRDFGNLPQLKFETAYESLKAGGTPTKIYVFFRESAEELDEAMRAFKDSFASKYGHFYCHFEHVDSVRFQLATQCLAYLPNRVDSLISLDEGGKVSLLGEHIADIENLPFAKLNSKRKSLKRQIAAAENEVRDLEEESTSEPDDEDLKDSLREARVKRHDLKEELKQYDGFLFSTALFFAKESAKEMDERVQKARELFEQGKVQAANKILDLPEMIERANRNLELLDRHREMCIQDFQAFFVKVWIVLSDYSLTIPVRVRQACEAYDNSIRIAREIGLGAENLAPVVFCYAVLLKCQNQFKESAVLYEESLTLYRNLAAEHPDVYESYVASCLVDLALLCQVRSRFDEAASMYCKALASYRNLAAANPEGFTGDVAGTLSNIAGLHQLLNRFDDAEEENDEALELFRKLAVSNPYIYEGKLARMLGNVALFHQTVKRFDDAESEYVEALALCRKLTAMKHEEYEEDLARTLVNFAGLHQLKHSEEAETEYGEALALYRKLAAKNPDAYEGDMARTLVSLAEFHRKTLRPEVLAIAEAEYDEALKVFRKLASANPDVYEVDIANTLGNLAILHQILKRYDDAENEYNESLDLHCKLVALSPDVYGEDKARTLVNLALFHQAQKRFDKAESEYGEALVSYRKLAAMNPGAYEDDKARTLVNLAMLHQTQKRFDEAESEYCEALDLLQRLMSTAPELYESAVAMTQCLLIGTLDGLSGRENDATALAKEALVLCRKCEDRMPGQFTKEISLLGERLQDDDKMVQDFEKKG